MPAHHKNLTLERWSRFSLAEQMANIGSEVHRALNWRNKGHAEYERLAVERALELFDFTLDVRHSRARLKEIARARELVVDHFLGSNEYGSTEAQWRSYFDQFNYLARRDT
ncbi:hypothetical protein KQH82_09225 [bacterium]|nr:hypothetical protein [bacterium]